MIAQKLLSSNGTIFISIDDNEVAALRVLCDELFGYQNFVANIIWEKKFSPQNDAKWLSDSHDHILLYAKNKEIWHPKLLERTVEMDKRYTNPDNDPRGHGHQVILQSKQHLKHICTILLHLQEELYVPHQAGAGLHQKRTI